MQHEHLRQTESESGLYTDDAQRIAQRVILTALAIVF